MKPASERIAPANRAGPAGQDEKNGLKGILGVGRTRQHPPANAQDHRPVAANQDRERILAIRTGKGEKPLDELGVGQAAERPDREQGLDLPERLVVPIPGHRSRLPLVRPVGLNIPILAGQGSARPRSSKENRVRHPPDGPLVALGLVRLGDGFP